MVSFRIDKLVSESHVDVGNVMILRVLCEQIIALGKSLSAVFIDYKASFDSVSHKFVD